jgi:hypothetical protein
MERRNFIKLSAATAVAVTSVRQAIAAELGAISTPANAPIPTKKSDFQYVVTPDSQPDTAIVPLGNATGRIMAFELFAGLPIIFDLRAHMQGNSVIAGDSALVFDYTSEKGETANGITFNKFGEALYEKNLVNATPLKNGAMEASPPAFRSLMNNDGIQPVVSYEVGVEKKTCWPMDLKNYDRQWIEASNVLKTVMRNAEIELTCVDFADVSSDIIVRRISVKNISSAKINAVNLFQYAPVNPSGRKSTGSYVKDWYAIKPVNYSYYDKNEDCLLFSDGGQKWWMVGSDQPSVAHDCNAYPLTRERINGNDLAQKINSTQGIVDAALCYGNVSLASGEVYSVDFFIGYANDTDYQGALTTYKKNTKNLPAQSRLDSTLLFWKNWHAKGKIPVTPNKKLNACIKSHLMLIKVQEFWTGGFPSDAFELPAYFFRDTARPALALAQFGYAEEAKNNMLVLAAIMSRKGYCNWYRGVDQWIKDITIAGLPADTVFPDTTHYSADDPALMLTFIGKIYQQTGDKDFIKKIWPVIPYTVAIARRDLGKKGTVAQVYGMQDDMIHWSKKRPLVAKQGDKGVECSYWNMFWVAGLEHVAKIAADLGHEEQAKDYRIFANQLRENLEKHFWDEAKGCYAYYYDPTEDKLVFMDASARQRGSGSPVAIQSGYLQPTHPHAIDEWNFMKAIFEKSLPLKDPTIAKYSQTGHSTSRYLYAKVHSKEENVHEYLNWYLNVLPFAGIMESFPYNNRIQVWARGELLMAFHEYIKMYYPQAKPV